MAEGGSALAGSGARAWRDGVGEAASVRDPLALHLAEEEGLLFVTTGHGGHRLRTVTVPTPRQRAGSRAGTHVFPIIRTRL